MIKQKLPKKPATITTFDQFKKIKKNLGKIVCTSGAYDPIHPGQLSCLMESKRYGDTLVVLVNGNSFLAKSKGRSFQDIKIRCQIVSCVRGVDYVIPFEIEDDLSVSRALYHLRPDVFTKGGKKYDHSNTPEYEMCKKLGIYFIPQVGLDRGWVGSHFVKEWEDYCSTRDKRNKEKETPEIKKLKQEIKEDIEYFTRGYQLVSNYRSWKKHDEADKLEEEMKKRGKLNLERKNRLINLKEKIKSETIDPKALK